MIKPRKRNVPCSVCNTDSAKYSCPRCRSPYCCVACCKEHKRIGCSNAPATLSSSLLKKDEEKKAVVVVSDRQDLEEPELEKHRLSTESKMALDEAAWIREELDRNVELLNLVRRVDCAKNRHAALEKARTENPVFRDWIDRVMLHLGLCEKQQNQIVFVGYS